MAVNPRPVGGVSSGRMREDLAREDLAREVLVDQQTADERRLVERVRQGDGDALATLFEPYEEMLRRHLGRLLRDGEAAEDVLQEVMLRVWTHAGQWRGEGAFGAWLVRLATHRALNHLRSVKRRRAEPLEGDGEGPAPGWMVDAASLGADQLLEEAERRRLLRGCIDELTEDKREVLRLVYDAHMEVRQVAAELEIPEGTVKSRLFHARRQVAGKWRNIAAEWENEDG